MKNLFSSQLLENKRSIACFVLAALCFSSTVDAQFVSARKTKEDKPQAKVVTEKINNEISPVTAASENTVKEESKEVELVAENSSEMPKAKRRSTMGMAVQTDSKAFFKQRNISNKLYFPVRSPYIPRVGGTDIRQEPVTVGLDRNSLIQETSANEGLEAPTVISRSPHEIMAQNPSLSANSSKGDGNGQGDTENNVTYQFQDSELVIDERHLQAFDPSKVPQNKFKIKYLRNNPNAEEAPKPTAAKTVLSTEYKGNMELVDPNEVLMFFEKEQEDGDSITVGAQFVVPYEEGPTPVKSNGSSANYEVTE